MIQQVGAWTYRNLNVRHSARAYVQEHDVFQECISHEGHACSSGRQEFLGLSERFGTCLTLQVSHKLVHGCC